MIPPTTPPIRRLPHGRELRAARHSAQQLSLLNRSELPLAARLTPGKMLVHPGGRDGFAFSVDTCRQRLACDVAVHVSIVAQAGRSVPVAERAVTLLAEVSSSTY